MMQVMRDIGGVEIPESLAKLAGEEAPVAPEGNGRAKVHEAAEESVAERTVPPKAK